MGEGATATAGDAEAESEVEGWGMSGIHKRCIKVEKDRGGQ